jgi:hypothetical protein
MLKKHPFFEGVNFKEVSKPSYKALKSLVKEILPVDCNKDPLNLSNDPRESDLGNVKNLSMFQDNNKCIFKGKLVKKNWYGNK